MRMTSSSGSTKILPSPILPVLAAPVTALNHLGDDVVGHGDLDLHLGQEVHGVFTPR